VYIETARIEELYAEISRHRGPWSVPDIELTPWDTKQMEIHDPFGNLLRFNERAASAS